MTRPTFKPATKAQARARVALIGPPGSGKTYTGLEIAHGLGQRVACIDTEHGTAAKYSTIFPFDHCELLSHAPDKYVEALEVAEDEGFDVCLVDSLSHAWMGKDGALEQVDRAAAKSSSKNSFFAWRDITPQHNRLVDAMMGFRGHIIVTIRTKMDYVIETDDKGKQVPKKIGLAPVQREGLEYEFDVVADMDLENRIIVGKTRCPDLKDWVGKCAGEQFAQIIGSWLSEGSPMQLDAVEAYMRELQRAPTWEAAQEIMREIAANQREIGKGGVERLRRTAGAVRDRLKAAEAGGLNPPDGAGHDDSGRPAP